MQHDGKTYPQSPDEDQNQDEPNSKPANDEPD